MNRTSMNREQVAREILKVARELTAKDLLTFANVNADKHLKKEAQQALRGFESVRDSIKWYQDGEWSADDAKGSIWALIDDLEKVEKTCALVRRTMKMLMEEINKKEELRREDAKR